MLSIHVIVIAGGPTWNTDDAIRSEVSGGRANLTEEMCKVK